jgi:hypothetical protein
MKTTPKDFFLHIGSIVALYVSAVSLINLLFEVINVTLPDLVSQMGAEAYSSSMRVSIASLIIVFPLYIVLVSVINKSTALDPEKSVLWVRKWLTYLTLFITGVATAVDLIVLVNTFLSGEITTRFLLKILSVLVVCGLIFAYYMFDVKNGQGIKTKSYSAFAWIASGIVAVTVVGSLFMVGSPTTARNMRFDSQRINDLQAIQYQLQFYWQKKGQLPITLADLNDPLSSFMVPTDPQTGSSYEYTSDGNNSFTLCALFTTESVVAQYGTVSEPIKVRGDVQLENWKHGVGRACFDRTIDPELYPRDPAVIQAKPRQ